jgi:hypothetical protein
MNWVSRIVIYFSGFGPRKKKTKKKKEKEKGIPEPA